MSGKNCTREVVCAQMRILVKVKQSSVQAWTDPEDSRSVRHK